MSEHIDEDRLTPTQRMRLKLALDAARTTIAKRRAERVASFEAAPNEVMADGYDAARADAERTHTALAETERILLERIDRALQRVDRDDFGLDVESGEAIGFARLLAIPWATRAIHREEQYDRYVAPSASVLTRMV